MNANCLPFFRYRRSFLRSKLKFTKCFFGVLTIKEYLFCEKKEKNSAFPLATHPVKNWTEIAIFELLPLNFLTWTRTDRQIFLNAKLNWTGNFSERVQAWFFLPIVNADWYEYTWSDDRNWRKTQIYDFTACVGADPNRNFPVGWGVVPGAAPALCIDTHYWPQAFSEPSVKNIADYFDRVMSQYNIIYYQNMHSAAEMILYPWG